MGWEILAVWILDGLTRVARMDDLSIMMPVGGDE